MLFTPTPLIGSYIIHLEKHEDNRGFFARTFCQDEFESLGLKTNICQSNISYNQQKGTLRGLHYQASPYEEAKLIHCFTGSIFDVILDLRPFSPTYKQFYTIELSADNKLSLYIPEGFAHGFETLQDHTTIQYIMFEFYHPENAQGIRWNDSQFNIPWPFPPLVISNHDTSYPDWVEPDS